MKANELRIGNLVLNQGELVELTKQKFKMAVISFNCQEIEPIPLTYEWLNKFGSDGHYGHYISLNDEKGGAIDFSDINDLYLVNEWHENFPLTKIKYVHSLQNLYFALTGKELKLNEI